MKALKWLPWLALAASAAYSAHELKQVTSLLSKGNSPTQMLDAARALPADGVVGKLIASQLNALPGGPTGAPAAPVEDAAPVFADPNYKPARLQVGNGGAARAAGGGGAVLIDASGKRFEIPAAPPPTKSEAAVSAVKKATEKAATALQAPVLDDPSLPLQQRRVRALWGLAATVAATIALVLWARRLKS